LITLLSSAYLIALISCVSDTDQQIQSVDATMDEVITRIYEEVLPSQLDSIDEDFIMNFLTPEEKESFATKYQYFHVNVPATVWLMRHIDQNYIPFWLPQSGFIRTDQIVKNDEYEYEVWQKDVEPGQINLGINGFDMHRPVYFVCVKAKNPGDSLAIENHFPNEYSLSEMRKGAFTYHDWSDLVITELPSEMEGSVLFTTVRGRAREAHIVNAFRKTETPSSDTPDQILLTWSNDPATTMDIQWRTSDTISRGFVEYWLTNTTDTVTNPADSERVEDRMLNNDRYINRFTSKLTGLTPGMEYQYRIRSGKNSSIRTFSTQKPGDRGFSFIWFGDTHRSPQWGELLQKTHQLHPQIAFYSIAGDLVSTGLFRDDWDQFFDVSGNVFSYKPLMPIPGNHDRQDGLGAAMYYSLFSLPKDGPSEVHPESTYSFRYKNALFLMIDSTHPVEEQAAWIEEKLSTTDAVWKFAFFHFPPYNYEEPYPDIQKSWCKLFDKYHVDMVMSGHVHYYMRTKPMNNGQIAKSYADGTVYTISIGIGSNHENMGEEPYAEVRYGQGQYYQLMEIENNELKYTAFDEMGSVKDQLLITK
jgi:acid phosphatase type 7